MKIKNLKKKKMDIAINELPSKLKDQNVVIITRCESIIHQIEQIHC